jgi:hypothetical protein
MQLNIKNVTPEAVEVQGQTVTRAFAEGVMLASLVGGARHDYEKAAIVKQYLDAGLSADQFPKVVQRVQQDADRAHADRERRLAESRAHEERFKSYQGSTPLEHAKRRAAREERERKMREMGQAIRAANGRSSFE